MPSLGADTISRITAAPIRQPIPVIEVLDSAIVVVPLVYSLATDADHRLFGATAAIEFESMAVALAGQRAANCSFESLRGVGTAQGRPQIAGVVARQAGVQLPGRRHAQTVAARTEVLGHRRDRADPPAGLGPVH